MGLKFGSIVMMLMFAFIAKISFETATADSNHKELANLSERSPASIDQSYIDHTNKR